MTDKPAGFLESVAALLRSDPLREKVLLAPSHRVGRQWLDRVAAMGGGFVNARASTIRRLVLDLAEPSLRRKGLRPGTRQEKTRLLGLAMEQLTAERPGQGYFTRLPASLGLAEMLLSALEELEAAMVRSSLGLTAGIASRNKADELAELARKYRTARARAGIAGAGEVMDAALEAMKEDGFAAPLVLAPDSVRESFNAMEWGVAARWPDGCWRNLPEPADGFAANAVFFAADSVANEAREVFRRIQALGVPLDRVEVVCVDGAAYVPALCAAGMEAFGGAPEDLPVTFNGGLPGGYSRPARLLAAWLEWLESDLPPEGLARMLDCGLVGEGWRRAAPGVSAAVLAARLRELPIDGEPGQYRRLLGSEPGKGEITAAEAWLARRLDEILPLANGGEELDLSDATGVLSAARRLLATTDSRDNKLDAYARTSLIEAVDAWLPGADWPGFDAVSWLTGLADGLRVMGLGPLPGRLHVGDLSSGGHSGREYTFIVGLDDSRYPGTMRQDPVLLDRERAAISPHLLRSGHWLERRIKALDRLLARARGTVFLSHAANDAIRSRELFPAPVYTRLRREFGMDGPGAAATLRPDGPGKSLNRRDDWLAALLSKRRNALTPMALAPWRPHLARGAEALAARKSDRFTVYDGYVPEAGRDFAADAEGVLSPTDMELLATCPLEFFFRRVLGIRPPGRYEPTPGRWLEGNERGSLLHEVFQDFLDRLNRTERRVDAAGFEELSVELKRRMAETVVRFRRAKPPLDPLAFRREERELAEACSIFLATEVERQAAGRPLYQEVALGTSTPRTPWDRAEPVTLAFDSGRTVRLKGRMDRIDRLRDDGGLLIIDYKTGRSDKFSRGDPFRSGRNLQPLLYTLMLERALADMGRPEPVRGFAYFFPMPRDEGRSIVYDRAALVEEGVAIVEKLTGILREGCFPFTTAADDVRYSDYLPLYGDHKAAAGIAAVKAMNEPLLAEWADLRGLAALDGEDG